LGAGARSGKKSAGFVRRASWITVVLISLVSSALAKCTRRNKKSASNQPAKSKGVLSLSRHEPGTQMR
jgi:hypothetical protein